MTTYRIAITPLDAAVDEPTETVIRCQSEYQLRLAIWEWISEEVDSEATFVDMPVLMCQPCKDGDHEDCSDGGLSRYPYWCVCAANRHGAE